MAYFQKGRVLAQDGELYLHPSQEFVVELPTSSRAAVVGSAGTGKTICAVRRTAHLAFAGVTVGYVCPNDSALEISKNHLSSINCDESYYLVAKKPDELLQLVETVDHMIIDEAQEIPSTWLAGVGAKETARRLRDLIRHDLAERWWRSREISSVGRPRVFRSRSFSVSNFFQLTWIQPVVSLEEKYRLVCGDQSFKGDCHPRPPSASQQRCGQTF